MALDTRRRRTRAGEWGLQVRTLGLKAGLKGVRMVGKVVGCQQFMKTC